MLLAHPPVPPDQVPFPTLLSFPPPAPTTHTHTHSSQGFENQQSKSSPLAAEPVCASGRWHPPSCHIPVSDPGDPPRHRARSASVPRETGRASSSHPPCPPSRGAAGPLTYLLYGLTNNPLTSTLRVPKIPIGPPKQPCAPPQLTFSPTPSAGKASECSVLPHLARGADGAAERRWPSPGPQCPSLLGRTDTDRITANSVMNAMLQL